MERREKSAAAEVVPWWLFVVVAGVGTAGTYAWISGYPWLWVPALVVVLVVPRLWWRHLRKRWRGRETYH
jgi:hypothetical protein